MSEQFAVIKKAFDRGWHTLKNPHVLASFFFLCVGLAITGTFLWTQQRVFFGEFHEPHEDPRTVHVKPGREFTQTFISEGRTINGVMFVVDTSVPRSSGMIHVQVEDGARSTSGQTNLTDAFPDGELYVSFSPPLISKKDALLFLRITSTANVDLKYQIDGSKYSAGELFLSIAPTQTTPFLGDLAFQVHYQTPAAQTLHLSLLGMGGIALAVIVVWGIFLWLWFKPGSGQALFPVRWHKLDWIVLTVLLVAVGGTYGLFLFSHASWWSTNRDYIKDVIYLHSGAQALQAGALPVWEMNMCGGQPLLGNPESNTISLGTLIAYVAGAAVGMKVFLWIEVLLATAGAYVLGRMFGLKPLGAALPALLLVGSGFLPNRAPTATMFVAGVAAMPWMFVTYLKSLSRPSWLFVCALVASMAFFAGDTHVVVYTLLAIGLVGLFYAWRGWTFQPLAQVGILVVLILLITAVKVLPVLEGQIHYHGKDLPPLVVLLTRQEVLGDIFLHSALDHDLVQTEHGKPEGWDNLSLYTGVLPLVLAVAGAFFAPRQFRWLLLGLLALFFLLGEGTIYDMYLRRIGEMRSLFRIPSRSLIVFILGLGIMGGYAVDWLSQRRGFLGLVLSGALLLFMAVDLGGFTLKTLGRIQEIEPLAHQLDIPISPTISSFDLHDSQRHPLAVLTTQAALSGTCPDFNNTPIFIRNYQGPMVTDLAGNEQPIRLYPNGFEIVPATASLVVKSVASPLLDVRGGWPRILPDGSLRILIPRTSSTVSVFYVSSVMLAGLALSLSVVFAWLLIYIPWPARHKDSIS